MRTPTSFVPDSLLSRSIVPSLLALAVVACGSEDAPTPPLDPFGAADTVSPGKADVADHVLMQGTLDINAPVAMAFTEDLEFHAFELSVRAGAMVSLEITQKGSTRTLDTTLYVYGPRSTTGEYGTKALFFDDDAGYGRLSKLSKAEFVQGGIYLVVTGTRDGRGRGNYRLQATCESGDCAPVNVPSGACHPAIRSAVDDCVSGWLADPDYDPSTEVRSELISRCADPEVAAPSFDALCATAEAPADLCSLDMEAFALSYLPICGREAIHDWLDGACVFGERYFDLFGRAEAMIVLERRVLTSPDGLDALTGEQIVSAVQETAHDDATTLAAAFDAVDENRVNVTTLWDASNRRAYTAVEVGAGDNSFGRIFRWGTTEIVARNVDGDLLDCGVTWGPEQRRCTADTDCADGGQCVGSSAVSPLARCRLPGKDDHPAIGAECGSAACPMGDGLVCQGASISGGGLCGPAWMRGYFETRPQLPIDDASDAGAAAQLLVYGLATVSTDVLLHLQVNHPRPSDLVISLQNPAGTIAAIPFEPTTSGELFLSALPISGFPGDESANGVWTLTVVDGVSGKTGVVAAFGLEVTSRWD